MNAPLKLPPVPFTDLRAQYLALHDSIHQRMQQHVAIRMRVDPAIERQSHATQDQVVALAERMYIETTADPH